MWLLVRQGSGKCQSKEPLKNNSWNMRICSRNLQVQRNRLLKCIVNVTSSMVDVLKLNWRAICIFWGFISIATSFIKLTPLFKQNIKIIILKTKQINHFYDNHHRFTSVDIQRHFETVYSFHLNLKLNISIASRCKSLGFTSLSGGFCSTSFNQSIMDLNYFKKKSIISNWITVNDWHWSGLITLHCACI